MIVAKDVLFSELEHTLLSMERQGYAVAEPRSELYRLPMTYDALLEFANRLPATPMRHDWPYEEPDSLSNIIAATPNAMTKINPIDLAIAKEKTETAFLASVCGCILGKPLEVNPDLEMLKKAFLPHNEWPIRDYISIKMTEALPKRHPSWTECCRENIRYVSADDDINYTVLGMLVLERHGLDFTHAQLAHLWAESLPLLYTFGPERRILKRMVDQQDDWAFTNTAPVYLNPGNEYCGALIRVDAYGYACPGNPRLAASLAYRDATLTHHRTGVYGAMFVAAAIAEAFVASDWESIFSVALSFIPPRSRFYEKVSGCFELIQKAPDFEAGYRAIHERLGEFGHCRIYQECATLMNTLRFSENIGEGICMQVMQGNDTDSFGCTAGSILGAFMGREALDNRWLAPFRDEIQLAIAKAPEHSLLRLAKRMAELVHIGIEDTKANRGIPT